MTAKVKPSLPAETSRMLNSGMRILPVRAKHKTPCIKQWQLRATTNREQIELWARRFVDCNWGVAAGHESNFFVVDVDGEDGAATLKSWHEQHGSAFAKTLTVITAHGRHLYYKYRQEIEIHNSAKQIASGIDIRGEGGFVVAPGSIHPSGHVYVIAEDLPVAEPESWLVDLIVSRSPVSRSAAVIIARADAEAPTKSVVQGGRNCFLTMKAGTMRRKDLCFEAIEAALLEENRKRCSPPLSDEEVRDVARSVSRYSHD